MLKILLQFFFATFQFGSQIQKKNYLKKWSKTQLKEREKPKKNFSSLSNSCWTMCGSLIAVADRCKTKHLECNFSLLIALQTSSCIFMNLFICFISFFQLCCCANSNDILRDKNEKRLKKKTEDHVPAQKIYYFPYMSSKNIKSLLLWYFFLFFSLFRLKIHFFSVKFPIYIYYIKTVFRTNSWRLWEREKDSFLQCFCAILREK